MIVASYEGVSICNENASITPFTNALGFYTIYQTRDQSLAFQTEHKPFCLVYLVLDSHIHFILSSGLQRNI